MSNPVTEKEYFFCRKGMQHIGPLSRRMLRRYLAAGLIDAQTLISLNDDGCMLPLGASAAAGEITSTVKTWQKSFSLPIYLMWLCFMPLFSAFFATWGIYAAGHSWCVLLTAITLAQLGMSYWLGRTWNLLLADKPRWYAWGYALPMALPLVNIFWVWIGYMLLPEYWKVYKHKLGNDNVSIPSLPYYFAVALFYLMIAGIILLFAFDDGNTGLIRAVVCISWLWFGATLLSLFIADYFTTRVIQKKLSNLAFGALQFAADIDYKVLHKTVLSVALSARQRSRILAFSVLLASYLAGGWFLLHALQASLSGSSAQRQSNKDCIVCTPGKQLVKMLKSNQSNLVNTNTVRQGK